ncbi:MAG: hypothetical protein IIU21_02670 [Schwartzia sp.]|nr:hypothetical protein [Schwartzia sp. (in: firmicutes)]
MAKLEQRRYNSAKKCLVETLTEEVLPLAKLEQRRYNSRYIKRFSYFALVNVSSHKRVKE